MLNIISKKRYLTLGRHILFSLTFFLYPFNTALSDVLVSGLTDISFSSFTGRGDISGSSRLCVCSDTNSYNITAYGSGTAGSFSLQNGPHSLNYTVYWHDTASSSGKVALTANTAKYGMGTVFTCDKYDCNGGKNAYLELDFSESDLLAAIHGSYVGSITIIVEPN